MRNKILVVMIIIGLAASAKAAFSQEMPPGDNVATLSKEAAESSDGTNKADVEANADESLVKQVVNPAEANPAKEAKNLYDAMKSGKWLVALGTFLMFLVWGLRVLFVYLKIHWFKTKLGGFALGIVTSLLLTLAIAWQQGQGISIALLMSGLGLNWFSAGVWGHIKDIKESMTDDPVLIGKQ